MLASGWWFYHGPISDPLGFELSSAALLKAVGIWTVGGHNAVEAGPAWLEALLFSFIVAFDQSHELAHAVT